MTTRRKKLGTVTLVSAGVGQLPLLTLAGADAVRGAELVVHDPIVAEDVLALATEQAERELLGDEVGPVVLAAARDGREIVVLSAGDPLSHPSLAALATAAGKAKIKVVVIPGVSSELTAAAYAGVPVGRSHTIADLSAGFDVDWAGLAGVPGTLILRFPAGQVGKAAASLLEHGRRGDTLISVTTAGATTRQRTTAATLDTIEQLTAPAFRGRSGSSASAAAAAAAAVPVVAVIGDVVKQRDKLAWWEGRPLFGWSVLVPRTREQGSSLSTTLRGLGAEPVEVPTIAVEPPRTPAPMERALRGLVGGRYAWVAFTSANAVKAMREKLEESGLDARAFAGVKLAAVGDATATALSAFGLRADLVPTGSQSSEGLLEVWPPRDEQLDVLERVLLPRADIATETLAAGLKTLGWSIDDLTAYRTVRASPPPAPVREALRAGRIDAVLFTSSSTVRNLVGIAGKPHDSTVIGVIGPQTAIAAGELGLRVDFQASAPAADVLARELADFVLARRAAELAAGIEPKTPSRTAKTRKVR